MGHALRRAASQRTGGFDPLTVGWTHAYWAEGPEFAALGLSNGAAVGTWPDEIGTADATQGTANRKPTFSTAGGPNSKPTLTFDGSNDGLLAAFTQAQPFTIVAVMSTTNATGGSWWAGSASPLVLMFQSANKWSVFADFAGINGTAMDTSPHLQRGFFSAALCVTATDEVTTSGNIGDSGLGSFGIGSYNGTANSLAGAISFIAVFNGDVTGDAKWASFKTWVTSHYGITVA